MPAYYRHASKLEGRYLLGNPGEAWAEVEPGGADHAWVNDELQAAIYTDSNCGPRYWESRTEDLAYELVVGFQGLTMDFEERQTIGGRGGIVRQHTGRLDGIPMRVGVAVVNGNGCTYDLVLVAPPGRFDDGWTAFEAVLAGFAPQ
jgi:hypothetical protein